MTHNFQKRKCSGPPAVSEPTPTRMIHSRPEIKILDPSIQTCEGPVRKDTGRGQRSRHKLKIGQFRLEGKSRTIKIYINAVGVVIIAIQLVREALVDITWRWI